MCVVQELQGTTSELCVVPTLKYILILKTVVILFASCGFIW